jgi:hypothetical protein
MGGEGEEGEEGDQLSIRERLAPEGEQKKKIWNSAVEEGEERGDQLGGRVDDKEKGVCVRKRVKCRRSMKTEPGAK